MKTEETICDMCGKDITYNEESTEISFNLFNQPRVDLCIDCSRIIYKLVNKKRKARVRKNKK